MIKVVKVVISEEPMLSFPLLDGLSCFRLRAVITEGEKQQGTPYISAMMSCTTLLKEHKTRSRSRSRTDRFQRWQKEQQRELREAKSCHLLLMNLQRGSHELAEKAIQEAVGDSICSWLIDESQTFGFATVTTPTLAEHYASALDGLAVSHATAVLPLIH